MSLRPSLYTSESIEVISDSDPDSDYSGHSDSESTDAYNDARANIMNPHRILRRRDAKLRKPRSRRADAQAARHQWATSLIRHRGSRLANQLGRTVYRGGPSICIREVSTPVRRVTSAVATPLPSDVPLENTNVASLVGCNVCHNNVIGVVALPCGHAVMCHACHAGFIATNAQAPCTTCGCATTDFVCVRF